MSDQTCTFPLINERSDNCCPSSHLQPLMCGTVSLTGVVLPLPRIASNCGSQCLSCFSPADLLVAADANALGALLFYGCTLMTETFAKLLKLHLDSFMLVTYAGCSVNDCN